MQEIDSMDMLGFLKIRAWNAQKEKEAKEPRQTTIDVAWPGLSPNIAG